MGQKGHEAGGRGVSTGHASSCEPVRKVQLPGRGEPEGPIERPRQRRAELRPALAFAS